MKKCINCGEPLEDNALFCSECGTKQVAPKSFCSECGTELNPKAKFCMECGTPVAGVSRIKQEDSSYKKPASRANDDTSLLKKMPDVEINEPDENTISIIIKGIPFNLKLVRGREYGTEGEILDFYLGETPVTQALWMTVMGSNPSKDNSDLNYPVTNVDESSIIAFLIKLHKLTGFKFELPLREQWKYAYKGGADSKGYKYSGSNNRSEIGWVDDSMHPVGELYPNELGLYDMEGLVDELGKYRRIVRSSLKLGEIPKPELTGFRLFANINPEEKSDKNPSQLQYLISQKGKEIGKIRSEAIQYYKDNPKEKKKIEKIQQERNEQNGFKDGLRPSISKDKYGYISPDGNWIIEPKFSDARYFKDGIAIVEYGGKYGTIDKKGKWLVEPKFEFISEFIEGLALAKNKNKHGFIDKKGNWVIEPKYSNAYDFSEGLASVEIKGKWGYVDKKSNWVIEPQYEIAFPFKNGVAKIMLFETGNYAYINKKGDILKNNKSPEEKDEYSEGLKSEWDNSTQMKGFIDKKSHWVIEPKFWGALDFDDGFAFYQHERNGEPMYLDRLDVLEM